MQAKQSMASRPAEITSMWKLIDAVADMERRVGQIYTRFAKMFSSRARVAAFWNEVAADERGRADPCVARKGRARSVSRSRARSSWQRVSPDEKD